MKLPAIAPFFSARVAGEPATQGSYFATIVSGKAIVIPDNKKLKPWRRLMDCVFTQRLYQLGVTGVLFEGAVCVEMDAILPRLAKHAKLDDPGWADTGLDLDKLQRAVGDSLTDAKVIVDDRRICKWIATKRWARRGEDPGVQLQVSLL